MVTIGDVFGIFSLIVGICVSGWAMILGVALIFPHRTESAELAVATRPWVCLAIGFSLAATVGLFAVALAAQPAPMLKIAGTTLYLLLLATASIGAAGIAQIAARRARSVDPSLNAYGALSRSSGLIVLSGLVPLLGWFLIAPLLLLFSLGAGTRAVLQRSDKVLTRAVS